MFDGDDTVLVVGAHPDDEVLGVGGTIARHTDAGDDVYVLIVTEGTTQQYDDMDLIETKRQNARECGDILGVTDVRFGELPDMRLSDVDHVRVNAVIENACESICPDIIYTHSNSDINKDHAAVYESTLVAARPGTGPSTILAYETPSSTDFAPNSDFDPRQYVDIVKYIEPKINGFESYETEVREYPHPRSARALRSIAQTRGTECGRDVAEAFEILRNVE